MTCAHVVEQAHTILLDMDNQRFPATIVGICPTYDVALLHCDRANVFLALDEREDLRQLEGDLTLVTERDTVIVLSAAELRQDDIWVRDTSAI